MNASRKWPPLAVALFVIVFCSGFWFGVYVAIDSAMGEARRDQPLAVNP
jgi:hypothetical protein